MKVKQNVKTELFVSKQTFDKLNDMSCCRSISENTSIKHTLYHQNKEYVITGSMGTGHGGFGLFFACRVIDLNLYTGPIKPLRHSDHQFEVGAGRRERGYIGQIIRYKTRQLVCVEEVYIKKSFEVNQLQIF